MTQRPSYGLHRPPPALAGAVTILCFLVTMSGAALATIRQDPSGDLSLTQIDMMNGTDYWTFGDSPATDMIPAVDGKSRYYYRPGEVRDFETYSIYNLCYEYWHGALVSVSGTFHGKRPRKVLATLSSRLGATLIRFNSIQLWRGQRVFVVPQLNADGEDTLLWVTSDPQLLSTSWPTGPRPPHVRDDHATSSDSLQQSIDEFARQPSRFQECVTHRMGFFGAYEFGREPPLLRPALAAARGFRGVLWGTVPTPQMIRVDTDSDTTYYELPDDLLMIGAARLSSLTYVFWKGQFVRVEAAPRAEDSDRLRSALDEAYGVGDATADGASWFGTDMILTYRTPLGELPGLAVWTYKPIEKALLLEQKSKIIRASDYL